MADSMVSNSMARTIDCVPNEILIEILRQLDSESLKEARLTCSRWARAGAGLLFRRVYFAPHQKVMEVFTNITCEPAFAAGVTELIYDGRMFWRYWTDPDVYYDAYVKAIESVNWEESDEEYDPSVYTFVKDFGRTLDPQMESESYKDRAAAGCGRYTELLTQLREILDTGLDMDVLCHGLQQLLNLTTVSIVHDFDGQGDFIDLHAPLPLWYGQWSAAIWKNTLPPISWSLCDEMAREAEEGEEENESLMDVLTNYPWDWRGVVELTKAISSYSPKITHLHYGSQLSKIPLYTLNDASVAMSLKLTAGSLKCFKFDSTTSVDGAHQKSLTSDSEAFGVLGEVLEHAQHLTTLSTSMHTWLPAWQRTFGQVLWPKLSTLELGDRPLDLNALKGICQRHQNTLVDLRLRIIHLDFENGIDSWEDVGAELGSFLKLRGLEIRGLAAGAYRRNGGREASSSLGARTERVGYQIMRWVPKSLIEVQRIDDNSAWVNMRLK
jgi:hypothetical protein